MNRRLGNSVACQELANVRPILRVRQSSMLAKLLLWYITSAFGTLLLVGCGHPAADMNLNDAKPELDLRRLGFDHSGCTVDVHMDDEISVLTDAWTVFLRPIAGHARKNVESALHGIVLRGGPTYRSDSIDKPQLKIKVYRYLRAIERDHFVGQGDYLVQIDGYWLLGHAFARNPGEMFDQNAIDEFFMSLKLFDEPRADDVVLPAWQEYQRLRKGDMPNAKFVIYMDPAPILLGSYSRYVELVKAKSFRMFTNDEYSRGGRMIGNDILEFYSKDDPTSVRIDVWVDRKPPADSGFEKIYSDTLIVNSSVLDIWSLEDNCSLNLSPGEYAVEILLVNRGKYETPSLTARERFERVGLERYEIYLNRHEATNSR